VAALTTVLASSWFYAGSVGWDVAALVFLGWTWSVIGPMNATATESHATVEDPTKRPTQLAVLIASVVSLVGVGLMLGRAGSENGATTAWVAGLGVASIALSWVVVHTLFTLRYALLYYDPHKGGTSGRVGGISFNHDAAPRYTDFGYLAFTIGMTFQVSDTALETHVMRSTVLRHALLSYLFGSLILAATVNLLVSLASS
jgi:uncharacterized membrane protein